MTTDKFEPGEPAQIGIGHSDVEIAERTARAVVELQDAIDTALLAGLIVEPNFREVDNRLTRFGTRIDSFVCNVRIYRKLT